MSGIPDIYRLYNYYNNSLKKSSNRLTTIAVSKENYLALKRLGSAGDSFNDVVTEVIKQLKTPLQIGQRGPNFGQFAEDTKTGMESDSDHVK